MQLDKCIEECIEKLARNAKFRYKAKGNAASHHESLLINVIRYLRYAGAEERASCAPSEKSSRTPFYLM
jgi:hypothetical protein